MGNKIINTQTIDDLISIMSLIIFWGGVGDQINHELFEVSLQILPSKRIGTNSREITDEFFSHFSSARIKEFIEDATDTFSNNFAPKDVGKKRIPQELDNAFMEEFGISLYKLGGIMDYFSSIALEQKTTNAFLIHSEATKEIRNHFNGTISEQEIEASLQLLSLKNRGTVQNLPTEKGFDNNDISPWRYNRRLSYLQRPIVFIDYGLDKDSPKIYWTPRHMNLSSRILTGLLISGRFKAPHKSKLEKKISKFSQSRRLELQTNAFMLFNSKSSDIVVQEIGIGLKCRFRNKEELGDIDILIIDNSLRAIFSIECKRTEPARNSKEMIEEVEKYLNPNNGYFKKHQRRHEWLDKNRDAINSEFGVDVSEYLLHSFFVTNEALSINFMKKRIQKLKIYSMYELKDKSMLDILNMCSN